jgi:uncharacterized protein YmfQ (DUF2313 family)
MGIKVQHKEQYAAAIRKLFPQGEYWEKQFEDPQSDCSLFCKAKTEWLTLFRGQMSDLFDESIPLTATETLGDWERVLTGAITTGLDPEERRALLFAQKAGSISKKRIQEVANIFGWVVTDVTFPYKPSFFGFAHFGIDPIAGFAAFSYIHIYVSIGDKTAASLYVECLRSACFGFCRFGQDRILIPMAASAIKTYLSLSQRDVMSLFEEKMRNILPVNFITHFNFGGV